MRATIGRHALGDLYNDYSRHVSTTFREHFPMSTDTVLDWLTSSFSLTLEDAFPPMISIYII